MQKVRPNRSKIVTLIFHCSAIRDGIWYFSKEKQKQRILHFLSISSSSSRVKSLLMNSALISSSILIWCSDSVSLFLSF